MKTILLILLPLSLLAQFKPVEKMAAGFVVGTLRTYGCHMQAGNFYFQAKINSDYLPEADGWDFAHVHNVGFNFDVVEGLSLYNGFGYSQWYKEQIDRIDGKMKFHYTVGFGFDVGLFKIIGGTDFNPMESYLGILLNSR